MTKNWHVVPRLDPDVWQHLLRSRGLDTADSQHRFFHPDLSQIVTPDSFPSMEAAVNRVLRAIREHEHISVWGDFDADGVTSTAIVWETLHAVGAEVMPYIPSRDREGHGFSEAGLQSLSDAGASLIITVDHGITAHDDIAVARTLGIDVIVTDHHEPRTDPSREGDAGYMLPECVAVIHPFLLDQPQKLAGCGVAYQFAYAIWLAMAERADDPDARAEFAERAIGLAAIGTIADLMPLVGDNRVLARLGLADLAKTNRPGLQELYRLAGINPSNGISMYDVGFLIGPRLNAPGRLDDALDSLRLVCARTIYKAKPLAVRLNDLNAQRQELLAVVTEQAMTELQQRPEQGAYILAHEDWPAGVCGLAAGKLIEKVYRPMVVMQQMGETCRGSARSIKGFDFTAALTTIADLLEGFGGHAMAAGFTAKTENLPEIERRLSALVMEQVSAEQLLPTLTIDAEVPLAEMTIGLMEKLKKLEPCGMENPRPVFMTAAAEVVDVRALGKDGKHIKLWLQDGLGAEPGKTSSPLEAVAFGFGHRLEDVRPGNLIDVVYNLDENTWNGKTSLQLKVKDLRVAGS
jgi:single-stranded-DNA-specific exonuclease